MHTVAYTAREFASQVARAAGRCRLLQSPPFTHTCPNLPDDLFSPPPRLLYLALHGLPDQPYLYGAGYVTALSAGAFTGRRLPHTVIYAPACHLADGPLLAAMLATQPCALVAGSGENWSPFVHRLGHTFRILLSLHIPPTTALKLARARLSLYSDHPAALDTLALQVYTPDQPDTPKEV